MKFFIVNSTNRMSGGQCTTMLIEDFVNARLRNYGSAVEEVRLKLLYPPQSVNSVLRADFQKMLQRAPRVIFFRAKARVEIRQICHGVNPDTMIGNDHLTFAETKRVVATAAKSLDLIRPRFRPADNFDYDQFIADARDALAKCPQAIRKFLA